MITQFVLDELAEKFLSESAHTFLLHLNVADTFLCDHKKRPLMGLSEVLKHKSVASEAYFVVSFNLAAGITFQSEEIEAEFLQFLNAYYGEQSEAVKIFLLNSHSLGYAMRNFMKWLDLGLDEVGMVLDDINKARLKKSKFFMAVILENLETIIPPNSANSSGCDDRVSLVAVLKMAQDEAIRRNRNILILLSESLTSISSQLRVETNGIVPIKINFPDNQERRKIFSYLSHSYEDTVKSVDSETFSANSAGMSCNNIVKLVKVASY